LGSNGRKREIERRGKKNKDALKKLKQIKTTVLVTDGADTIDAS